MGFFLDLKLIWLFDLGVMPEDLFVVTVLLLCGGQMGSDGGEVDDGPRRKRMNYSDAVDFTSNGIVDD